MPHLVYFIKIQADNETIVSSPNSTRWAFRKSELKDAIYVLVCLAYSGTDRDIKNYRVRLMHEGNELASRVFKTDYSQEGKKWYDYEEQISFENISFEKGEYTVQVVDITETQLELDFADESQGSIGVEVTGDLAGESDTNDTLQPASEDDDKEFAELLKSFLDEEFTNEKEEGVVNEQTFIVEDLPEDYTKYIRLNNLILTCNNPDDEGENIQKPQQVVDINRLEESCLSVSLVYENLLEHDFEYELIISLYNETGLKKEVRAVRGSANYNDRVNGNKNMATCSFGDGWKNYWREGEYRIEFVFMDQLILVVPFNVGRKDLYGEFNLERLQPHLAKKTNVVETDHYEKDPLQILKKMVGLANLKKEMDIFVNRVKYNKARRESGIEVRSMPLHAVFLGNPGTGKTTVAKLMGRIFYDMGLLSKGHVCLEERSTLIGKYYGSEEEKVQQALEKAAGGVLFIDEAYQLYIKDDPKDPGKRALEALLTTLSDETKRDIVIILAGYTRPMLDLLNANPGLKSRFPNVFRFNDYDEDELMQIADYYLEEHAYKITEDAREAMYHLVKQACMQRDEKFGNGRYIHNLLDNKIIPALALRLVRDGLLNDLDQLNTIRKEDVVQPEPAEDIVQLGELNAMVGLEGLKKNIISHLNLIRFLKMRNDLGKYSVFPMLHMVFIGNPGTGKTTVADLIGEIYHSLGLLSSGHIIQANRSVLISNHIGGTEQKTKDVIESARGGVLIIDEADTLCSESKDDFGPRVLETIIQFVSGNPSDILLILTGYPGKIEPVIEKYPLIKSCFPNVFYFEDYTTGELIRIAEKSVGKSGFRFSSDALNVLEQCISEERQLHTNGYFGNAEYVQNLIHTRILLNMSSRLSTVKKEELQQNSGLLEVIEAEDVLNCSLREGAEIFDEAEIQKALNELDGLVGLGKIKQNIHHFVRTTRMFQQSGKIPASFFPLKWSFAGNTGTGKSTVAEILARLLKAMRLLNKGHLVELKAEELYSVAPYKVDEILKRTMEKSFQGVLFVDGDAPMFKGKENHFDSEQLRIQLSGYAVGLPGTYALIIAEHESVRQPLVHSLYRKGITAFDHTFIFEDYTSDELLEILTRQLEGHELKFTDEAMVHMSEYIGHLKREHHLGYANARTMKLIADTILRNVYARMSYLEHENPPVGRSGLPVMYDDVSSFVWSNDIYAYGRRRVGFMPGML